MVEPVTAIVIVCIALPVAAAAAAALMTDISRARNLSIAALGATLILLLEVLRRVLTGEAGGSSETWLIADELSAVPLVLFAGLSLVTSITAPRRDMDRAFLVSLLTLTSSTLAAYAAGNLIVFLAAWAVPVMPFAFRVRRAPRIVLAASAVSLGAAVALTHIEGASFWAFAFLVLAAMAREYIFPFHRAAVASFEDSRISLPTLLVNSHLGVFLIARVGMTLFPEAAREALPWIGGLALFTSIYTAVLALAEREPRRILAMLMVSQSSAILAGFATASHEGIAGALVQWIVLGGSSTVLITVYRSLEARVDQPLGGDGFHGFASSMPRLAAFFAISSLTMVGLPGTLGFAGEDLLLHGVLAGYPWWGAALPVAIALNAYHAFRLFARLFLGRDDVTRGTLADALPRERWALSACLALLVWAGLVPQQVVSLQAPAVGSLVRTSGTSVDNHP